MQVIKALLSFFSYVFHGLLCLAMFAMTGLAMANGAKSLQLGMLPWNGTTTLFIAALLGLVIVLLAIKGTLRPLFFVWSLFILLLLVKGYIFSSYHFSPGEFRTAVYLIVGSFVALLGAWASMSRKAGAQR